jgi:hypothetical protein
LRPCSLTLSASVCDSILESFSHTLLGSQHKSKPLSLIMWLLEPATRRFRCDWESCNKVSYHHIESQRQKYYTYHAAQSFDRLSVLRRHYRIHINDRPYICTTHGCGKRFIQSSALKTHMRTHTGDKPYRCQYVGCGKRFSDVSWIHSHTGLA